jgi:hypothetical protein
MNINHFFFNEGINSNLHQKESPIKMHDIENKGHSKEILILKVDNNPRIPMQGNINPNIGQQAKGINEYPTKNPNAQQANIQYPTNNLTLILSLKIGPTASDQNITHIMNDQDHCPR